jgi:hypothetical protein
MFRRIALVLWDARRPIGALGREHGVAPDRPGWRSAINERRYRAFRGTARRSGWPRRTWRSARARSAIARRMRA